MSPTCSTLSRCLQNQRHFWTRLLYLLSRFVVRHRLNCLVLVYIYLYYFTSGKTYFAFQIWRPLKWFRYPCYDVGCYPCNKSFISFFFSFISQWGLSVAMETLLNLSRPPPPPPPPPPPTPMMLHIKFDQDLANWLQRYSSSKVRKITRK